MHADRAVPSPRPSFFRPLLLASVLLASACRGSTDPGESHDASATEMSAPTAPPLRAPAALTATLPALAGPLAPSEVHLDPRSPPDGKTLADVDGCEPCHASVVAAWRTSAHAFASFNNPIYRLSVDAFREDHGARASRNCAGCHDPALLVDGLMDAEPIDTRDPRATAGVSCRVCHGITQAKTSGNGSYTLAQVDPHFPAADDAAAVARHVAAMTPPPLREDAMCASCHESFTHDGTGHAHFLGGADDFSSWARSYYGGSALARVGDTRRLQSCRECHMERVPAKEGDAAADDDGRVASHASLGAHTYLAAMRGDAATQRDVEAFLRGVASIDVATAVLDDGSMGLPAERLKLSPGAELQLDVVVRNQEVGHRFPGGTRDAQDTWIEIEVEGGNGKRIAEAGLRHRAGERDPTAHQLRAEIVDDQGRPLRAREVTRFRAYAFDHTIEPREAHVVQYAVALPSDAGAIEGLTIVARLQHRSRPLELARAACKAKKPGDLDACVAQPITTIDEVTVTFGTDRDRAERAPAWRRLADHALALLHARSEPHRAEASLAEALELLGPTAPAPARAEVLSMLGQAAAQQGRLDDALAHYDRASEVLAGQPAHNSIRGRTLARAWRFEEAIEPLTRAVSAAPEDGSAHAWLAFALGRAGRVPAALEAAQIGLAVEPRHPDLLRVQAVALEHLGAPTAVVASAREAAARHRLSEDADRWRRACSEADPGCALEQVPVHVHRLGALASD